MRVNDGGPSHRVREDIEGANRLGQCRESSTSESNSESVAVVGEETEEGGVQAGRVVDV